MHGLITTRHLFTCAPTIIVEFGVLAYLRCVGGVISSRGGTTFLDCIYRQ